MHTEIVNQDKKTLKTLLDSYNMNSAISEEEFDSAIGILCQYLLFDTSWEGYLDKFKQKIPILKDMPMLCKAHDCPYYSLCPVMRSIPKADHSKLLGTECRADKLYGAQMFTDIINELGILPENTTDIINVASLVRNLILRRRMDWDFAIEGIIQQEPGVIDQRTGQVYWKRVVNPLLKASEALDKQIAQLQKQLLADRQAKVSAAASFGGSNAKSIYEAMFGSAAVAITEEDPHNFVIEEEIEE